MEKKITKKGFMRKLKNLIRKIPNKIPKRPLEQYVEETWAKIREGKL